MDVVILSLSFVCLMGTCGFLGYLHWKAHQRIDDLLDRLSSPTHQQYKLWKEAREIPGNSGVEILTDERLEELERNFPGRM